ncbi:MAG: hypothetical protein J7604_07155 [Sporocytophaga sp.]|uniref:hypothetical protein n=1 Tax=Sporocytophaga sp. TaxID=2231183 RepID=UPI001B1009C1|nr:hypothetical protein [Sporocytophaga sp.]MBO9699971.1 hypothetical protein [Sporocytophaga sp.]
MCDFNSVLALLTFGGVAIALAAGLIGIAIITNSGFFTAGRSIVIMILAAVNSTIAATLILSAVTELDKFLSCILISNPSTAVCVSTYKSLRFNMNTITTILIAQSVFCIASIAVRWSQRVGKASIAIISATLIGQAALLAALIYHFNNLRDCILSILNMNLSQHGHWLF